MQQFLEQSKKISKDIAILSGEVKNRVLNEMADALLEHCDFIVSNNEKDMSAGRLENLDEALLDRLLLTGDRVKDMSQAIKEIANLKEPVGRILDGWITDNGLNIQKVSIPIGVIGIIYESRPNVTSDTAALCFKSGNVCVLKGGKEAEHSNKAIANVLKQVSQSYISCEELGNKLVLVENEVLDVELRDASDVIFNVLKESNVKINSSGRLGNIYYQILENNSVNEDIINKRYNIKLSGQKTSEYKTVTNKINGNDNIVDRVYVRKFENVLPNTMESTDGIFLILTVSKKSKVERAFKNFNALNAMDNQPFNNFGIFYVYENIRIIRCLTGKYVETIFQY